MRNTALQSDFPNGDLTSLIYGSGPLGLVKTTAAYPGGVVESIPVPRLIALRDEWIASGRRAAQSERTLEGKVGNTDRLLWFLRLRGYQSCGAVEVTAFIDYLREGHLEPGGRFLGMEERADPRSLRPMSEVTRLTYHVAIKSFWHWMIKRGYILATPFSQIEAPDPAKRKIKPFSDDQVTKVLEATKLGRQPCRDRAMLLFLLDTGVRVTELCNMRFCHWDKSNDTTFKFDFIGKGNKELTCRLGKAARDALWRYFREEHGLERFNVARGGTVDTKQRRIVRAGVDLRTPIFLTAHRARAGEALTRSGVLQIFQELKERTQISGVRCSPHTCRHTFAITFLRRGGNMFALKEMLGHESLETVMIYVSLAQSDMEEQHRRFSPGDWLAK